MTPSFGEERRRLELSLLFLLSAAAHGAGLALVAWLPALRLPAPPRVIAVELVAAAPAPVSPRVPAPAPEPIPVPALAPEPVPAPVAPPAPAPPEKIVLPKQPRREPSKPREVAKPKPAPRPEPVPTAEPPPRAATLEDALAELRAEAGEPAPEPAPEAAELQSQQPRSAEVGQPVSPEVAAWMRRTEVHIRRSWVTPPEFTARRIVALIEVELDAAGGLIGAPRLLARSGNPWYDQEVLRAVQRASPLPVPPRPARYQIAFDSQEGR